MDDVKYAVIVNELSKEINADFEWCMKTQLIFENEGKIDDPETTGFLKGVEFCTTKYLDILERAYPKPEIYHAVPKNSGRYPYKSVEDLPEELEPADYITGGNKDE